MAACLTGEPANRQRTKAPITAVLKEELTDGIGYGAYFPSVALEALPATAALSGGVGVWVVFFNPTTVALPCVMGTSQQIALPAGHFIIVGNPFDQQATVSGAQMVDTFNPTTNSYASSSGVVTLQPGQGAWVFSSSGGTLTIAST